MAKKPRKYNWSSDSGKHTISESQHKTNVSQQARRGSQAAAQPPAGGMPPGLAPMSLPQMIAQAGQIATAQTQPQLDAIGRNRATEASANTARTQDITGWGNWQQGNLDKAFEDTRNALNQVVAGNAATGQEGQQALMGALGSGADRQAQLSAMIGAPPIPSNDAAILAASKSGVDANQRLLAGDVGSQIGAAGTARGLAGITLQSNQRAQEGRHQSVLKDLSGQESDIRGQIPGLVSTSLKDLRDFELSKAQFGETKANNLFQQYLAEQQLGQAKKDQTFQQWLAKQNLAVAQRGAATAEAGQTLAETQFAHQSAIDWANVGINRTQAEGTLAQIRADVTNAKDAKAKEKAKARGDALSKALGWLGGYLAPGPGENPKSGSTKYPSGAAVPATPEDTTTGQKATPAQTAYKRTFDEALKGMTTFTSRSDALRILAHSNYTDWARKATYLLNRMKRRPPGHGNPVPDKPGT